jgi:hypothetical protein
MRIARAAPIDRKLSTALRNKSRGSGHFFLLTAGFREVRNTAGRQLRIVQTAHDSSIRFRAYDLAGIGVITV